MALPYTKEKRIYPVLFAVFGAAAIYGFAKKGALLLKQPSLWPLILFFLPKINFISFRNETAGIRFDDCVLLIVAAVLFVDWCTGFNLVIEPLPKAGFIVVGVFCLSNLINRGGHSNILYSLRLAEYMIFFWCGKSLVRSGWDLGFVVKCLIGVNCAVSLLQGVGIIGGFSALGYESETGRPYGLSASYPAEMGALFNVLFASLAFGTTPRKFWGWCLIVGCCVFMIGSRSALLAHCLMTVAYVYQQSKNKSGFFLKTAFVAGMVVFAVALVPNQLTSRSTDLISRQNLDTFRDVYDNVPIDRQFTDVAEGGSPEDAPEDVDVSWYIRAVKWAEVVKTMLAEPWSVWIFGLGPGAIGIALDGGWLRVVVETGVVGTVAFLALLRKIAALGLSCSMAVFALGVNMIMIDSHMAYKVMAFLFFLAGAHVKLRSDERFEAV